MLQYRRPLIPDLRLVPPRHCARVRRACPSLLQLPSRFSHLEYASRRLGDMDLITTIFLLVLFTEAISWIGATVLLDLVRCTSPLHLAMIIERRPS
jgi:hypothetical protein